MEWPPKDRVEIVNIALPLLTVPVPRVEEPFLKVTIPVGVPAVDVTVAVKVTDLPNVDGFNEDATEVEVIASTFCSRTDDVLPLMLTAPP